MIAGSLRYFAKAQAAEFAAGWNIVVPERLVRVNWGTLFSAVFPGEEAEAWRSGVELSGKIDRIDYREETRELRVLDYKTAAKPNDPAEVHLPTALPGWGAEFRSTARTVKGRIKEVYWDDLQLPLYVLLVRHVLQGKDGIPEAEKISAGYFNLPLELPRTGIYPVPELGMPGILESAAKCADAVLKRIFVDGIFWPPSNKIFEIFPGCAIAAADFAELPPNREAGS